VHLEFKVSQLERAAEEHAADMVAMKAQATSSADEMQAELIIARREVEQVSRALTYRTE
jgi:hypothetical protein